jgi:hypothetical protein
MRWQSKSEYGKRMDGSGQWMEGSHKKSEIELMSRNRMRVVL